MSGLKRWPFTCFIIACCFGLLFTIKGDAETTSIYFAAMLVISALAEREPAKQDEPALPVERAGGREPQ